MAELVTLVSSLYPEAGASMRTLLLSLIVVNQIAGPVPFRRALVRSGEVNDSVAPNVGSPAAAAVSLE